VAIHVKSPGKEQEQQCHPGEYQWHCQTHPVRDNDLRIHGSQWQVIGSRRGSLLLRCFGAL
jgi:hypothetical protein